VCVLTETQHSRDDGGGKCGSSSSRNGSVVFGGEEIPACRGARRCRLNQEVSLLNTLLFQHFYFFPHLIHHKNVPVIILPKAIEYLMAALGNYRHIFHLDLTITAYYKIFYINELMCPLIFCFLLSCGEWRVFHSDL